MIRFLFRPTILRTLAMIFAVTLSVSAQGQQWLYDDMTYYRIGGGQTLGGPASYRQYTRIGGDASLRLGYSCGAFDAGTNIRSLFNRFAGSLDTAVNSLIYAAQSSLASMPLYLLRQANPGLAQMLETNLLRYEQEYRLGVKSCREAEKEILAGGNPYYNWVRFGQAQTWREGAQNGQTVDSIEHESYTKHGCVTWINGQQYFCDPSDTREIPIYSDVVRAGYDLLVDSAMTISPESGVPSRLQQIWPTAEEAVQQVVEMTGETNIGNARATPPASRPPRGVSARLHEDTVEVAAALQEAISLTTQQSIGRDDLAHISSGDQYITPALITALGALPLSLRTAAVNRIAGEIALLQALERINLARRVLLAGLGVPEVAASPARTLLREEGLPLLETEARLLKDEYDLRTRVRRTTAEALLQHDMIRRRAPLPGGEGISPMPYLHRIQP